MVQGKLENINVTKIKPNKNNPRKINTKKESFKIIPVHLRGTKSKDDFTLLAGERRFRATKQAGLQNLPAIVHRDITDEQAAEITYTENLYREELEPLEAARAVTLLLKQHKNNFDAVAKLLDKSHVWVRTHANIEKSLSTDIKKLVEKGDGFAEKFTIAHLAELAKMPETVQKAIIKKIPSWQEPTVKDIQKMINDETRQLKKAPFDTAKCEKCIKRTANQPGLWSTEEIKVKSKDDKCLDAKCWRKKEIADLKEKAAKLKDKHPGLVFLINGTVWGDNARRLKSAYGKCLDHYQVSLVKKTSRGAVPAYIVFGKDKGKIVYVKVKSSETGQPGKTKKLTEKDFKNILAERIQTETQIRAVGTVKEKPLVTSMECAIHLYLILFGLEGIWMAKPRKEFLSKVKSKWNKTSSKVIDLINDELWRQITEEIENRIDCDGTEQTTDEIQLICELMDIDIAAIKNQVESEPEFQLDAIRKEYKENNKKTS